MIKLKLKKNAQKIDNFLKNFLNKQKNSMLLTPMKYGVISGGKKIRSTIIFDTGKIFNLKEKKLISICAAVECIHSYSLIHDDLPCMDNDALRRGKPSTYKKFGEATAVLAGNSLLTLAFEIISDEKNLLLPYQKNKIIKLLANCSGHTGIAGGQELDLKFENKKKTLKQIIEMQTKKTGKLFSFSCVSPVIIAKEKRYIKKFEKIGSNIGILFQIIDDLIDLKGNSKIVGKKTRKDVKKGKATLISLLGYQNTINYGNKLKLSIFKSLKSFGSNANDLKNTINFIMTRLNEK